MNKSLAFALILIVMGCLLLINTFFLLNNFLYHRITLFSDYARYSKAILPVIVSGLASILFIGFGFMVITRDKHR
ncbi:MAG TPA: hypothetical protein VK452_04460 [Dissulfurispiraceae bacterium]|nr:hypothetical protein [Dissulfurispiraceae bacterium]